MRERVRQFDLPIRFESDGSGTRVLVTFPAPQPEAAESETGVASLRAVV